MLTSLFSLFYVTGEFHRLLLSQSPDVRLMKHKNGQHTVMVRSQSVRSM